MPRTGAYSNRSRRKRHTGKENHMNNIRVREGSFYIARKQSGSIGRGYAVRVNELAGGADPRIYVSVGGYALTADEFADLFGEPAGRASYGGHTYRIAGADSADVTLEGENGEGTICVSQQAFAHRFVPVMDDGGVPEVWMLMRGDSAFGFDAEKVRATREGIKQHILEEIRLDGFDPDGVEVAEKDSGRGYTSLEAFVDRGDGVLYVAVPIQAMFTRDAKEAA